MDPSVFKGMKLVVSTPMYRPEVAAEYKHSHAETLKYLRAAGIGFWEVYMTDTYLPRGRNLLAMHMLDTEATHHLLFDADMGWDAEDVMRMLYHAATDAKYEIIGAAYPQKRIDWDRVKQAVISNPNISAQQLEAVAPAKWTFHGVPSGKHDLGMPVELTDKHAHVGTGIMVIRRSVYETMKKLPIAYRDCHTGKQCWRFFHADTNMKTGEWVGEDVWFCREWKKMGGRIWLAPWVKTKHVGQYSFVGDMNAVLEAGAKVL